MHTESNYYATLNDKTEFKNYDECEPQDIINRIICSGCRKQSQGKCPECQKIEWQQLQEAIKEQQSGTCESCNRVTELEEIWKTYHGYKNSYCHVESAIKGFNCLENYMLDHHSHKICIYGWRDKYGQNHTSCMSKYLKYMKNRENFHLKEKIEEEKRKEEEFAYWRKAEEETDKWKQLTGI